MYQFSPGTVQYNETKYYCYVLLSKGFLCFVHNKFHILYWYELKIKKDLISSYLDLYELEIVYWTPVSVTLCKNFFCPKDNMKKLNSRMRMEYLLCLAQKMGEKVQCSSLLKMKFQGIFITVEDFLVSDPSHSYFLYMFIETMGEGEY